MDTRTQVDRHGDPHRVAACSVDSIDNPTDPSPRTEPDAPDPIARGSDHPQPTPGSGDHTITEVAKLVGDRWSVLVVRNVFRGLRRFQELHDDLGVSRAVLSQRLRRLTDAGVLTKVQYQTRPARYEYRLTEMGLELSPVLVALLHWGDRWLGEGDRTAVLVHAPCDTELRQAFWCPTCKTTFGPTAIRSRSSTPPSSRVAVEPPDADTA